LKKDYQILIIFGTNHPKSVCALPGENKSNKNIALLPNA